MKIDFDIILLDEDQPATCPKCGARTDFIQPDADTQIHQCLECGYTFIGQFDDDFEDDDEDVSLGSCGHEADDADNLPSEAELKLLDKSNREA